MDYSLLYSEPEQKEGSIVKCGRNSKTLRQRYALKVNGKKIRTSYDGGILLTHANRNNINVTRTPKNMFILGVTDDMYPDQKAELIAKMYGDD